MDWWQLYLLAVLPQLGTALGFVALGVFMVGIGVLMAGAMMRDPIGATDRESIANGKRLHARLPTLIVVAAVLLLLSSIIPSERGLMLMLGGYVVTNTDGVENLPENFVGAANAFLERYAESGEEATR